jgi:hypothetical protein
MQPLAVLMWNWLQLLAHLVGSSFPFGEQSSYITAQVRIYFITRYNKNNTLHLHLDGSRWHLEHGGHHVFQNHGNQLQEYMASHSTLFRVCFLYILSSFANQRTSCCFWLSLYQSLRSVCGAAIHTLLPYTSKHKDSRISWSSVKHFCFICIQKVMGSSVGPGDRLSCLTFLWISSVPPGKYWYSTLN